ncbi:MAG: mannose-1-phosphate guanylyltransferase [Oscillatoria sp. PMC 1051.18]|nr:mannose-1-phosphate guanylyltransferase [Oscillatoria sp. PMC 1050.18]MEC5030239.1 mannose-1-phosphate guanylyltransferase [Oscillatoria sp. PMC 1051.18]
MNQSLIPVILAGGKGERFWPLSRQNRPKQFLSLDGSGKTLLEATADRLLPLAGGWERLWVCTAAEVADGVRERLPQLPKENILIEPERRDTAPAVAWTTLEVAKRYGQQAVLGFFPADHWIGNQQAFQTTLQAATELASNEAAIATLGITPTYPSTGYGYIEQGELKADFRGLPTYKVTRFTEKPDRQTAESFISTGRFSWNSGMFIFRASVFLTEMQKYASEIFLPLQAVGKAAYGQLTKKSIDYALMEKTQLAYVVPANFGWDDLGDWNALERLLKKDNQNNVELADHVGQQTKGAIVYASDDEEVIVTIGLEDLVIVRDGKVTLVAQKNRTQEIKQVLKQLQTHPKYKKLL